MNDNARRYRVKLENIESSKRRREEFSATMAEMPVKEVGPILYEISRGIRPPVLDHLLIEGLYVRLQRDDELFRELTAYLVRLGTDADFWFALLRFLSDCSRRKTGQNKHFQSALWSLAGNFAKATELRAVSLHNLNVRPTDQSFQLLSSMVESSDLCLIDAAAHKIAIWQSQMKVPAPSISSLITALADLNLSEASRCPGVLLALAGSEHPEARAALDRLAEVATGSNRVKILRLVGNKLTPDVLASSMRDLMAQRSGSSERAIETMLLNDETVLSSLYDGEHHFEYLYAISLSSRPLGNKDQAKLERLLSNPDREVSREAARLMTLLLPRSKARRILLNHRVHEDPTKTKVRRQLSELARLGAGLRQAVSAKVADGFNTDMHKSDAMYRELGPGFDLAGEHWHAAIYAGFWTNGQQADLSYIQAAAGPFETMEHREVIFNVESPETPIRDVIAQQIALLRRNFQNFNRNVGLHGERRTAGITPGIAEGIVATAQRLLDRGIGYTALNMMNSNIPAWSGAPGNIGATRCDGVVEYCYERNGQIVCSGIDARLANITRAGRGSLDNHNNVHLHNLEPGELCPRVQAGDQGEMPHQGHLDTRMTTAEGPTVPEVEHFFVTPWFSILPPMINFRIKAPRYDEVYVRITVSKNGDPFRFVRTESLGTQESPDATWRFERVHTGQDVAALWIGKTTNGDFRDQDGDYEFRLIVVDLGGNVSELRRDTLTITWP